MNRNTLILSIIMAVVIVGGGAFLWLNRDTVFNQGTKTPTTNTTTETGVTPGTNVATPTNLSLPVEVKGDTNFTGKLKVGEVDITLNSLQKQAVVDGKTAPEGQTYLLVYFDPVPGASLVAVDQGLRAVHVLAGQKTYPLLGLKVVSPEVKNDRGFLKFLVPAPGANLQLELGSGATAQRVKLP